MIESPHLDYWTPARKELRAWFTRNASSLGDLYEGALHLVSNTSFPGRVRFIAHAVREIRNRLPDAISGPKGGTNLQYKNRLDYITKKWQKAGFPTDSSLPIPVTGRMEVPTFRDIPIPRDLYLKIAFLIQDHISTREKPFEAAERLFQAIDPTNRHAREILRPRISQWIEMTDWFVSRAHDNGLTDREINGEELQRRFERFEDTLKALVLGFFETMGELDEILEQANS